MEILNQNSEKFEIISIQLMKAKSEMGSIVLKDSANPFHKSKYASLGAHLELSEAILAKHGLLFTHAPNLIDGKPVLVATLHHPESGQWLKSYLPLLNPKEDSQGYGASLTYMRRYSINSMLGLSAEDDDGESACIRNKPAGTPPSVKEKIGKAEIVAITTLLCDLDKESNKSFLEWIKKEFEAPSVQDIPKVCFENCMVTLNAKIKYLRDKNRVAA